MCTELYYIKPAVDQERKVESPMLPYKLNLFFVEKEANVYKISILLLINTSGYVKELQ